MNTQTHADNSAAAERPGALQHKKFSEHLKTWITKLSDDQRTLRDAFASLMEIGNSQSEVPLIVRLAENPQFNFSGLGFFKGRVTLQQHDFIHILLGRGLTLMDESFVIGFTMGSTDRCSTHEANLFSFINQILYPKPYRFTPEGTQVFKDAVALGYVSDCTPLETVDFEPMLDWTLRDIRAAIHLETDLLQSLLPHRGEALPALLGQSAPAFLNFVYEITFSVRAVRVFPAGGCRGTCRSGGLSGAGDGPIKTPPSSAK